MTLCDPAANFARLRRQWAALFFVGRFAVMVKNVKSEAAEFGESVGHGGTKTPPEFGGLC